MPAPLARPAERVLIRPRHRFAAACAALIVLIALGAATLLTLRPPTPLTAQAPPGEFSAARAYAHAEVVAARTHPAGSAANDEVRSHLERELRALGLEVQTQETVGAEAGHLSGAAAGATLAQVRNVVARLPGTDPTGRVFLVAHYDSVQVGPGGNDDAAGTAALLEVARALTAGPAPRNDIVFVLTDAEEACLCGAQAFAAEHPLAAEGGVVLNLEARGSTGPVIMFQTSERNAALVDVFGEAAAHPLGTSFAVEIYRLLPNDTDFTAFLDNGFAGLNSAYIDGAAIYHTPLDTAESLDRGSLQHHGANALGLAREFGRTDLTRLDAGGDATYFPVLGSLVSYPGAATWPLAALALLAVAALGWLARRQGRTSWSRLAAGFGLTLVPLVAAPVAAQLLWAATVAIRPGYATLLDPYRPVWYRLAVVALAATILLIWYALLRRRVGPAALAIGGLGWLAIIGLVLAAVTPGGAYLAVLPALAGALAGLVALRLKPDGFGGVLAVTAATAVTLLLLVPTIVLLFPALGMKQGGVAALFAVLLGLAALPVLDLLFPAPGGARGLVALRDRRLGAVPALVAGLATVAFLATGLAVDRFDADHPVPTHLLYALDTDDGSAHWLSRETDPQPWTSRHVDGSAWPQDRFPGLGGLTLQGGPAQAAGLPAPKLTTLADTTAGDVRTLRLRLEPQRTVRLTTLHVSTGNAAVLRATVAGRPVEGTTEPVEGWGFGVVFHAPPAEGVEIELVLRADGPVTLRAMDASDGLTGLPGFQPRPAGVGVVGSHSSEMVAVARTYRL
ncbi:M28 family peptidase [Micromonosporaceae bacterium DT194]|uniref:M28 family peptidase n=1 Tax=Melissospora conviva TaxID=3388432 RepID=UPI003C1590ED